MSAQNRAVGREIAGQVWPLLAACGFEDFTGRRAWLRDSDVVDFQAVGGHAAKGVGCTPFSFGVRLGVRYVECEGWDDTEARYVERPGYSECTFQIALGKRLRQPRAFHPWGREHGTSRADVWGVGPDASNVREVVTDAAEALVKTGLPLLELFSAPEAAYQALLTRDSTEPRHGTAGIGMPGAPGSPRWLMAVEGLASRLGRNAAADIASAPLLAAERRQVPQSAAGGS